MGIAIVFRSVCSPWPTAEAPSPKQCEQVADQVVSLSLSSAVGDAAAAAGSTEAFITTTAAKIGFDPQTASPEQPTKQVPDGLAMEMGVMTKSSVISVLSLLLISGCDAETPPADPFAQSPVAFARGSTFAFFSDDPGLWESSNPTVARITESDARRVVVRFEGQGSTVLDFFPLASGIASTTSSLRSVPAELAQVSTREPLDGTRVLVGGRVAATMVYLDKDLQPLAGAGLLAEPESTELTSHHSLQVDTFDISPTTAGRHEFALEVQGIADTVLVFDAVSEDDIVITLAVDTSGERCEVVATVTDSAGMSVVGWSSRLHWDGDPTQFGERWLHCREAGDSVTANIGATAATLVF